MIRFRCPSCRKEFAVGDEYANRQGRCKACGTQFTVPQTSRAEAQELKKEARPPVRIRRLIADAQVLRQRLERSEHISLVESAGDPPDRYVLEFRLRGLTWPQGATEPQVADTHRVEIQLPEDYPRLAPVCRMLSPIFHPNIDPAKICVGDHWTAGEQLIDLVVRIGEMIAFQAYNIRSPLDGEAAMWADLNGARLPIDSSDVRAGI